MSTSILIGVDGGGTSCRMALLCDDQRFDITLGHANVATNRDPAIAAIQQGLDQVLGMAGLTPADLAGCDVYMGLAGIMSRQDAAAVADAFDARQITVSNDRELALPGAFKDRDGTVASIGTGSFVGRRVGGHTRFVGGWGFVLDDTASGAWLGREALKNTLRVLDGFYEATELTDQLMAEFQGSAADLVGFSLTAVPAEFAVFVPTVLGMADELDKVAIGLMQAGADYIEHSLTILGWQPSEPLCLIGGLGPHYAAYLPADMASAVTNPKGTSLDGALFLASQLSSGLQK